MGVGGKMAQVARLLASGSQLPASAWHEPLCCGHLRTELADGRTLSLTSALFAPLLR